MKKLFVLLTLLIMIFSFFAYGCDLFSDDSESSSSAEDTTSSGDDVTEIHYGLPVAQTGHYIKDADLIQDGATRYLVYTTNIESGEEDSVIAIRSATFEEGKGWAYGEEHIAVSGTVDGWDKFIGSASIVKGEFALNGENYSWLLAYNGTDRADNSQSQIGLALAKEPLEQWVKASTSPIIAFDGRVYGETSVGCYAPSLVNMNRENIIRLIYTYADIYGHFEKFVDLNATDIGALYKEEARNDVNLISGTVQMPTNGSIAGGDAETMFPNGDFMYDSEERKFYVVKDYSPSAGTKPNYAEKIQLLSIDENELYTVEILNGWEALRLWDMIDTPESAYERLYGACIVCDAYGHKADEAFEVVYNVCDIEAVNADWMFSQKLLSFEYRKEE